MINKLKKMLLAALFVSPATAVLANEKLEDYGMGKMKSGVLHVSATEASELLDDDSSIVVLDVRTAEEHSEFKIRDHVNIDYLSDDFRERLSELDKDQVYLLHCGSGGRSGKALPTMHELGFSNVIHLDGGTGAWTKAGLGSN